MHVAKDTDFGILLALWKSFGLDLCLVLYSSTAPPDISLLNFHWAERWTIHDIAYERLGKHEEIKCLQLSCDAI